MERKKDIPEKERGRGREGHFDNKRRVSSKEEGHRRKITESAEQNSRHIFPGEGQAALQVYFQERAERYYRFVFPREG